MRIGLYASAALPSIGGQETVVDALATQYSLRGHEVVVLAPRPSRRWASTDRPRPYHVAWHPRFISKRRFVDAYGWWLDRVCRRWRCEIVHCHGIYPPAYLASRRCPRQNLPFVVTSHGEDVCLGQSRMNEPRIFSRHVEALAAADALIAISRFTHEGLRRLCPTARHIADIPNGVETAAYRSPVGRPAVFPAEIRRNGYFLFIGRLVQQKGVDLAIEALARLPRSSAMSLVVAGNGPERPALEGLARSRGIADRVHFVGPVEGHTKTFLLQNSRALVAPSRKWEAFGLVVLESHAAGRPVIGTRLPGMADLLTELLDHGAAGWVVAPDDPEALADAFGAALRHSPTGAERFAVPIRYTWPAVAEAHLALYEQVLSKRRGTTNQGPTIHPPAKPRAAPAATRWAARG